MLTVNEIFESVQGEGNHAGRVAIFIRFTGCNLSCSFCDTKYSWKDGTELSIKEIMDKVREFKSMFVILTGGEPTIQPFEDLQHLVSCLHHYGYQVAMETNGTNFIHPFHLPLDWITVSPKSEEFIQSEGDELKLLYDGTQNLEVYEKKRFRFFYLQPILPEYDLRKVTGMPEQVADFMERIKSAIEICVRAAKERPLWRVSFQSHKVIGVR
jgi:organic radical activating enzyme